MGSSCLAVSCFTPFPGKELAAWPQPLQKEAVSPPLVLEEESPCVETARSLLLEVRRFCY